MNPRKTDQAPDDLMASMIDAVERGMRLQGMNRTDLSRALDVHPSFVTNILNRNVRNTTITTFARMLDALGYTAEVRLRPK